VSGFAEVVVAATVKVSPKNSLVRGKNRVIGSELRVASTELRVPSPELGAKLLPQRTPRIPAENAEKDVAELPIVLNKARCRLLPHSGSIFNACKVLQILRIT
jgi:hypothetical protein